MSYPFINWLLLLGIVPNFFYKTPVILPFFHPNITINWVLILVSILAELCCSDSGSFQTFLVSQNRYCSERYNRLILTYLGLKYFWNPHIIFFIILIFYKMSADPSSIAIGLSLARLALTEVGSVPFAPGFLYCM